MRRYAEFIATKRGLATALHSGDPAYETLPAYFERRLQPALSALLLAAAASGEVRADVEPDDLLRAVAGLCMTVHDGDGDRRPAHGCFDGRRLTLRGRSEAMKYIARPGGACRRSGDFDKPKTGNHHDHSRVCREAGEIPSRAMGLRAGPVAAVRGGRRRDARWHLPDGRGPRRRRLEDDAVPVRAGPGERRRRDGRRLGRRGRIGRRPARRDRRHLRVVHELRVLPRRPAARLPAGRLHRDDRSPRRVRQPCPGNALAMGVPDPGRDRERTRRAAAGRGRDGLHAAAPS